MKLKKIGACIALMFILILPVYAHAGLWDKFTTWVVDTWDTVEERVEEIIEDVVTTVEDGVTSAIGFFVDTGEWIYDGLTTVVEGSLNFFYGVADGTVTALNYFGLDLDISDWFTTGGQNSEDGARLWSLTDYDTSSYPAYLNAFRDRQVAYIERVLDSSKAEPNNDHYVLRAYYDLPLDKEALARGLTDLFTPGKHAYKNPDMRLIEYIRLLAESDEYDDIILSEIIKLPYWQDEDTEGKRVYTSENHVLMWLSSSWLLSEMEGWDIGGGPEKLRERLVRYLEVKKQFGVYESTSNVYSPFSLTALLNLYDYAQDTEIKTLAGQVALIFLNDIAMVTNDLGAAIAVDSRTYEGVHQDLNFLNNKFARYTALITGKGPQDFTGSTHMDIFAMTTLDVSSVAYNRLEKLNGEINISYSSGHPITEVDTVWAGLDLQDKLIFSQSAGAYAHPELIDEMLEYYLNPLAGLNFFLEDLIVESNLADDVVDMSGVLLTETSAPFTTSSIISEKTMDLYRHGNVQLSSYQDFHAGNAGWQQLPWIATTGTIPVYTRSGAEYGGWKAGGQEQMNTHLPYIKQNENVAMVLYKPAMELRFMDGVNRATDFLPVDDFLTAPVNLHWPTEQFDEATSFQNWLFAREGDGYVAVYRHCLDTKTFIRNEEVVEVYSCSADEQVWATVVGNTQTHESFSNFIFTVSQAKIKSKWYWSWAETRHVWETTLEVDGKTLSFGWEANVDDLTDREMWELASANNASTIEMASVSGFQVNNVTDTETNTGHGNCESSNDVFLHQNVSFNGFDPTILRMAEADNGECYLINVEDQSQDMELIHEGEKVDVVRFTNRRFVGGEADKANGINHEWTTIELDFSYENPVVFASVIGIAGTDPITTEIRNITSTSFDVRVAEFAWNDGIHTSEVVHYVVMEAGSYSIANGLQLHIGAVALEDNLSGSPDFETVGVDLQDYLLISQVQGSDREETLSTRVRNKKTGTFEMSLMVQEANSDNEETIKAVVGYLAVGKPPVKSLKVALKGAHGKYLGAAGNGGNGKTANANASVIGSHETIVLTGNSLQQGCLIDGDEVWLQSTGGYYYSAQQSGALDVDRTARYSWETFKLINHSDNTGCLRNGDVISLYNPEHGNYIVAESDGQANANRKALGSWEKFIVYDLNDN
ncbi:fascin domain-containing protein [Microbulbifer sp. VAAC004]|uniref:fascin domain-containing protein n=1 Tax=unclassified Microbulbifer TaxID=2619833 RepID=UPI00403A08C4